MFSPAKSIIRGRFSNLIPPWITRYPGWRDEWGPELMALDGRSMQFDISMDGKVLVSAASEGSTKVWDIATGFQMATL